MLSVVKCTHKDPYKFFSQSFVWICFVLTSKENGPLKQTPFTKTNKDPRFPWLKRCDSLFRIKAGASRRWKEAGVQPRCSVNWLQLHMIEAPILTQWTDWRWNARDKSTLLHYLFTTEYSQKPHPTSQNNSILFCWQIFWAAVPKSSSPYWVQCV